MQSLFPKLLVKGVIMKKKPIIVGIICLFIILVGILSFTIIPTGYVGVKSTMGQIEETPVRPGTYFIIPIFQRVRKVCTKQTDHEYGDKIWSETANRTAVYFEGTIVTTSLSADRATWLVANVADYDNPVTSGMVQSAIKSASKGFNDTDVTNRSIIEPAALEALQKAVDEKYGVGTITINRVVISNADFDLDYQKAIADKQKAQLDAESQAINNQRDIDRAKAVAEATKLEAQGEADAIKVKAQGEADAIKVRAEAQAEANKLLESSLTPQVLKNKELDKWNGAKPKVVVGSDSSEIMIGLDGVETE